MPMVSVIIPNYNHAEYLHQRIQSVLDQTWPHFEIIILDDCSTDNSKQIIEEYRYHDKVGAIIFNPVNSGSTFKQWIKGIEVCKSEFVWIAESDDWCEPTFLDNIMNGLLKDDTCVFGYCQSYIIEKINHIKWISNYPYLDGYVEGNKFIKDFMMPSQAIFNASMVVWRRSAFNKISKEFMDYKFCGDWLFWIEMSMHGNVFITGKVLNYFRRHDKDVSGKANLSGDSFLEELNLFHSLYKRKWISYKDLFTFLKHEYIAYKAIEKSLKPAKRVAISQLFSSELEHKDALVIYYMGFYSKHAVKKIFNSLIS
ncbi:MAG: glycosyltransferase family 2 protein [Chitinophagaceae bacterium]